MLNLKSCIIEVCDGFTYVDKTGPYASPDNVGGYGPENGVTGPSDFDAYVLSVWFPESDTSGPADYTLDLLTSIQPPNTSGFYSWDVTALMMGLSKMTSGVYSFSATATKGAATYITDNVKIFVKDVKATVIDPAMKKYDPNCPCDDDCTDPTLLFAQYLTVACYGVCDSDKAQKIINNLYDKQNCC